MRNRFLLSLAVFSTCGYVIQPAIAQIQTDGSTATQVNGNVISPTGVGTVNDGNLFHSFNQFNVTPSGAVFSTGSSSVNGAQINNIINRVTGDTPSSILGTIQSRQAFPNANLYLINPNGIVFGQNARLDIGGSFNANTGTGITFGNNQTFSVDKNSTIFPSGDPKSIQFAVTQPAGIINQGNLQVDTGKGITLTGGSVINTGTLTAPNGNISLTSVAGGSVVELRSPNVVLGLTVTSGAVPPNWNGKITDLPKLAELLTGKFSEANQVVVKPDGSLALVATPIAGDLTVTNGMTVVSGKLDVSSALATGGNIGIFGERVGLVNAQVEASGWTGGGTVLIGGDLQGKGIAPNALRTFIDANSRINVSAILQGDGGKAIVWADQSTRFLGTITANAGAIYGNGGFVEVSGKANLDYRGSVSTLAPNGKIGTLLLDPTDINVIFTSFGDFTSLTEVDQFADPDVGGGTIASNLINASASNVILQATRDINFNTSVTISSSGVGLTAQAGRDINFTDSISTNGGEINFSAGRNITGSAVTGNLSASSLANAGNISLTAGSNISVNSLQAGALAFGNGGNITVQAGGSIQTTGTTIFAANSYSIVTNSRTFGSAGNISLTSSNGAIRVISGEVQAVATNGNAGSILIQAAGNIQTGTIQAATSVVGNGGQIRLISGGTIDSTLGFISANGANGNAGNIFLQGVNNITTGGLTANVVDGSGNAGQIRLISTSGAIDTSASTVQARTLTGVVGLGGSINFQATGNISTNQILATGLLGEGSINLTSSNGAINAAGSLNTSSTDSNAGNITLTAQNNITTNAILTTGLLGGGNINLTSSNGTINAAGSLDTSSTNSNAGNITLNAKTSITAANLIASSSLARGGNINLDPTGDIVFNFADTSGATQGGDFRAFSSGGNIRAIAINPVTFGSCAGSSICTVGGTGGSIFIRHGGLNPFTIGDASINGTLGFVTSGTSILELGKIIPVGTSIFSQGNIAVAPSGSTVLEPPPIVGKLRVPGTIEQKLLGIREVLKKQVDLEFQKGDLAAAFDLIERAYVSELEVFSGNSIKVKAIDIENAQNILSDVSKRTGSAAVLIYPVILSDRLEIMVIPPKDKGKPFNVSTRAAPEQVINGILNQYRADLLDSSSNDYLPNAQKLYDWIMRPIDAELQARKIDTVVFVMDSGLRVIPPGALHDGKQFLIERYAAVNIAALRVTRLEDRDRKNTRILAMGLTEAVGGFSALPSVDVEIRTISSELLAGNPFLNKEFTVSNLQAQRLLNDFGIVHLGTHGKFVSDTDKDSFIQFWDRRLTLDRIPKLRFDNPVVEMLTLSACETAVGNNLGISGLAVESGARSVLASLWAISDAGTAPFMINLYQLFPKAKTKALAIQQAQRSLLDGTIKIENGKIIGIEGIPAISMPKGVGAVDLRHPFFWSPFILVGNWL
ncbi:MAG: hypothetical protein DCF19_15435 [Pseudanabaena frigida]|uniref:Filamentous haemagglutinin FhaB/tRNA nuclease CdiA-like TPS domain-containing protein n=1 Tax=Pseudanabaena frigida TaxID=945775 RepID=A0A2W4W107_9CYAN|nr:MAG: hypothetical protein DCF19_15435 [Pseudanabaena frigida]